MPTLAQMFASLVPSYKRLEAQSYTEAASIVGCRAVRAGELLQEGSRRHLSYTSVRYHPRSNLQESADSADKLRQRFHLLEGALAAATSEFECAIASCLPRATGQARQLANGAIPV